MNYTGLKVGNILLPKGQDYSAWACIACDQFTSEKEYWESLEQFVGDKKSTLNLTLPEIYLEDNAEERIKKINAINAEKSLFMRFSKFFLIFILSYISRKVK